MNSKPDGARNILIADDSGTARMIIRKCFEIAGLNDSNFIEAQNGHEVLVMLESLRIDLLVTDLNMPVLDGKALLEKLKSTPGLEGIPVIVITSGNNPSRERELKKLGADLVLGKPISPAAIARAWSGLNNRDPEVVL